MKTISRCPPQRRHDPGTFLVRGHQRRCSSACYGTDDASHRQYKGHGPIYSDGRPALYRVAGDRRHGRCGRWDAHYGSHVATELAPICDVFRGNMISNRDRYLRQLITKRQAYGQNGLTTSAIIFSAKKVPAKL